MKNGLLLLELIFFWITDFFLMLFVWKLAVENFGVDGYFIAGPIFLLGIAIAAAGVFSVVEKWEKK